MRRCLNWFVPWPALLVQLLSVGNDTKGTLAFVVLQQQHERPTHTTSSTGSSTGITIPVIGISGEDKNSIFQPRQHQLYHRKATRSSGTDEAWTGTNEGRRKSTSSTVLHAVGPSSKGTTKNDARRRVLLSRTGPHFKVDRMRGEIEFGATANLVTQLPLQPQRSNSNDDETTTNTMIDLWLLDESRGLAMSIWDPKLTKDLGDNIFRLQIMTLQFVTITLAPWVDVQMVATINDDSSKEQPKKPEFIVQSIGFDPNIQILPGMRINGDVLGIVIEVAGVLRPGIDGQSVTGSISFQTSGKLPPPLRLLPDAVLKSASDTINTTIVNFAIQSFQKGAKTNFQQFIKQYELKMKKKESD